MSQPLLFLAHPVALSRLALAAEQGLFRNGLRQFPGFQQAFMDERLEALLGPLDCAWFDQFCTGRSAAGISVKSQHGSDHRATESR